MEAVRMASSHPCSNSKLRRPQCAHLEDAEHHLLIHVGHLERRVDADTARFLLLEVDVGRIPIQPHADLLRFGITVQCGGQGF